MNPIKIGLAAVVAIAALSFVGGSFYQVDEGERTVIVNQGKVSAVSGPGFGWKTPFLTAAHDISIRTQVMEFRDEPVYTADRQTATVTFSVNYFALAGDAEITKIYRDFQTLDALEGRVLRRQIREAVGRVFGTFTADTAIREKERMNKEVMLQIADLGEGLVKVEGVNLERAKFSPQVEEAAEKRAKAEMDVQTEKQNLEKEKVLAQVQVTKANAEADSNLARKKAEAAGVRALGEAEAAAIKAKSDALAASPALVELTKAEKWNGALPTTFVPGSAVPFLNIK